METELLSIPSKIFIVPYRNRPQHKFFFCKHISFLMETESDYEIYIVHQSDDRPFNRGAIKNIGFIAMRDKYRANDAYKNITFVFNDIDTVPFTKLFNYNTEHGVVKHFYGFTYALGGIVSITGADFERINGFPSLWGWGREDNELQARCHAHHISIDRSHFYKIGSPEILQLFDGMTRIIQKKKGIFTKQTRPSPRDGLQTITQLLYSVDTKSTNMKDNIFVWFHPHILYINVLSFDTYNKISDYEFHDYDLRETRQVFANPKKISNKVNIQPQDWNASV